MNQDHLESPVKMKLELEAAKSSLNGLSLTSNVFGDYMVVMESEVSIILSGEPYVAFMLLVDVTTGNYFARIWNETVQSGTVNSEEELFEVCDAFFWQGRPCLGCPVSDSDELATDEFIISHTPIKRKYSKACQRVLIIVEASDVRACKECLKLSNIKCETVTENHVERKEVLQHEIAIQPQKSEDDKMHLCLSDVRTVTDVQHNEELEDQEDYVVVEDPSVANDVVVEDPSAANDVAVEDPSTDDDIVVKVVDASSAADDGNHSELVDQKCIVKERVDPDYFPPEESSNAEDKSRKYGKYPRMITEALQQAENNMLCSKDIFKYIEDKYPNFGDKHPNWQSTIRQTLSINRNFQNVPVPNEEVDGGRKGRVWTFTSSKDPSLNDDGENRDDFRDILEGIVGSSSYKKPPLNYSFLIMEAVKIGTEKNRVLSFNEVCQVISRKHPYYDMEVQDWQLNIKRLYDSKYKLALIKNVNKKWEANLSQKQRTVKVKKKVKRNKEKPPYTYEEMISQAFDCSDSKVLSRKDIYDFIHNTYPYYSHRMKHWRAAVMEALAKNPDIKKVGKQQFGTNTFSLWKLVDGTEVQCPKCVHGVLFQSKDEAYFNHMRNTHFYGEFTCPLGCDIKAEYAKELTDHMEQEEKHEGLSVQCPLCGEYVPAKELEPHYATCVNTRARKPPNKRICPTCGEQIGEKRFEAHLKTHSAKEDGSEPKEPEPPIVWHYCEQCGKRYQNKHNLVCHIKAHHEGVLYQCQLCPKTFKDRSSRWQHKNLVHSTDERYNCKYCRLRFGTESELRRHLPTHEVERQFTCRHCGKKFPFRRSLVLHERGHTGDKPHVCPEEGCGKRWISSSGLARHRRQVHGAEPTKNPRRKKLDPSQSHIQTTQLRHLL